MHEHTILSKPYLSLGNGLPCIYGDAVHDLVIENGYVNRVKKTETETIVQAQRVIPIIPINVAADDIVTLVTNHCVLSMVSDAPVAWKCYSVGRRDYVTVIVVSRDELLTSIFTSAFIDGDDLPIPHGSTLDVFGNDLVDVCN